MESEIFLLTLNNKGIHTEGLFLNLDRPRGRVPVAEKIMVGRAQVIQAEARTATVQGDNRHLDGDNNDDTWQEKYLPSVNDRTIDAGDIFLDLDLQHSGGSQKPINTLCHEAAFLENNAPLFHKKLDGSEKYYQEKDRMER